MNRDLNLLQLKLAEAKRNRAKYLQKPKKDKVKKEINDLNFRVNWYKKTIEEIS